MSLAKSAAEKTATGEHGKKQKFLKHRARAIMRKGFTESQAYAIATKKGQEEGFYRRGTRTLTPKGRRAEKRHESE